MLRHGQNLISFWGKIVVIFLEFESQIFKSSYIKCPPKLMPAS